MVPPPTSPSPPETSQRTRLSSPGEERPRFLLGFPEHPALEPLIEAFEQGNFAKVREQAPLVVAASTDEAVRRAAQELLARIEPDPMVKALLSIAVCLFLFVVGWVYLKQAP